ncbi:MAG: hypothetical protein PVI93_23100, partial [Desulfobacterales bacterium]
MTPYNTQNLIIGLKRLNKNKTLAAGTAARIWFRLIAICCILAAVPVPAATDVPPADRDAQLPAYVPGELLVKF